MIATRLITAAAAAAALAATPGVARQQTIHQFSVEGATYTVPVPEGYCLPEGANIAAAEAVAALDKASITHATFDRCGSFGEDYVHIKTPIENEAVTMPKPQFIALLAREMQTANGRQQMEAAMKEVESDIAETTDNAMGVKSEVPTFAGQDQNCAYMTATLDVTVAGEVLPVRVGSCLTLVGQQFFAINSYAQAASGVEHETLKARSGAVAAALALATAAPAQD